MPQEKIKRKAKKTVPRTYKDEQGYLGKCVERIIEKKTSNKFSFSILFLVVTTNETVEYSCSDEENDIVPVEPIAQVKESSVTDDTPENFPKKKKITSPKVVGKQGSILNFFSKK